MDKNKDNGFPRALLKQPDSARNGYFRSYTVAHPKLKEANDDLSDAIREAIPGSLILVCGPTGAGKTTLRLRTEQRIATEMLKELEADSTRAFSRNSMSLVSTIRSSHPGGKVLTVCMGD